MMKAMPNSEHEAANGKRVVAKGTDDLAWRFAKAGTFEFACLVPGHFEAGMHGTIIVKDACWFPAFNASKKPQSMRSTAAARLE